MGDYSAMCSLTGIPITMSQQVVGVELEPYKFAGDGFWSWIPKSMPVFGEYDMAGGIEDQDLTPHVALFHKDIWDHAEQYWHYLNRKRGPNFLDIPSIQQEANRKFKLDQEVQAYMLSQGKTWDMESLDDCVYDELRHNMDRTDEGLTMRHFSEGLDVTGHPDRLCFLHRTEFMQTVCHKIATNTWTQTDAENLYKIVCLWVGQKLLGKLIAPCIDPYIEQYPNYKQRIKLMKFHLSLMKTLQRDLEKEEL